MQLDEDKELLWIADQVSGDPNPSPNPNPGPTPHPHPQQAEAVLRVRLPPAYPAQARQP